MHFLVVIDAAGDARKKFKVDELADICGKPLVVRVAQRAQASKASAVIVATDKNEILVACQEHGIKTMMIPDNDPILFLNRIAEIAIGLNLPSRCAMVSVPRNEPLVSPDVIDATASLVLGDMPMASSIYIGDYPPQIPTYLSIKVVEDSGAHILQVPLPSQCKNFGRIKEWYSKYRMTEVIAIGARLWEGLKSFVLPASGRFEDDPQFWALFEGRPLLLHITETEPITGVESMDDLEIVRALFRNQEIDSACCVELPIDGRK